MLWAFGGGLFMHKKQDHSHKLAMIPKHIVTILYAEAQFMLI